jgi:hypothetical protein
MLSRDCSGLHVAALNDADASLVALGCIRVLEEESRCHTPGSLSSERTAALIVETLASMSLWLPLRRHIKLRDTHLFVFYHESK